MTSVEHESKDSELAKITVVLSPSDWHSHRAERLWAQPLGANRFLIKNVPFFAYGLSYDDTVIATRRDEAWDLLKVAEQGGHSTYRIFVTNDSALLKFAEYWNPLERLGCTFERASERLFAIDVPPTADLHQAYELLQAGEGAKVWDFEEAHVGHAISH